ncbi:GntR family transcriptional repressor for pyruvate dehydrogenase complex [Anoxybacillus tepidamans]|uniref:GntR family transcriptional repressor for pyruvate dehydrogenase complex n=1 Tax=Anoxybacteroides tepidamans TaxID=265948 RepID=A0A7W8IRQ6_9BACL|nr:GntR family transcriptional regulator [Anoxybacillus tepidamans]MBB5324504.1 GntR family transcriptional repressor for pyruvate dehydrogenase complex [Anoxybacillus tepidamans]
MTSKMYVEILQKIYRIIEEDGLSAGDKIPSERELSERLKAGRSSVREALRSLEFLGIIETRRGEGTYLKEFGEHQLIDLLGMFILQDKKAKADLVETKWLIEQLCLLLACERRTEAQLDELKGFIQQKTIDYETFFKWVLKAGHNYLLERIWRVLNDFFRLQHEDVSLPLTFYEYTWTALKERHIANVLALFTEYVTKRS